MTVKQPRCEVVPGIPDVLEAKVVKDASSGGGEHSSYGSKDWGSPKRGTKPFIMSDWSS
jgi:hypothetical protein